MARLSLQARGERIASALAGRDVTQLPRYLQVQVDRFARAIGVDTERFLGYKPSTRAKYIRAAKQGRTAEQERERVRAQRRERETRKRIITTVPRSKRTQIDAIAARIRDHWGVDTTGGPTVHMDDIAAEVLLSDYGITEHIRVYGEDYVLDHLQSMLRGVEYGDAGPEQWRAFKASAAYPDEDERWFWYHSTPIFGTL